MREYKKLVSQGHESWEHGDPARLLTDQYFTRLSKRRGLTFEDYLYRLASISCW